MPRTHNLYEAPPENHSPLQKNLISQLQGVLDSSSTKLPSDIKSKLDKTEFPSSLKEFRRAFVAWLNSFKNFLANNNLASAVHKILKSDEFKPLFFQHRHAASTNTLGYPNVVNRLSRLGYKLVTNEQVILPSSTHTNTTYTPENVGANFLIEYPAVAAQSGHMSTSFLSRHPKLAKQAGRTAVDVCTLHRLRRGPNNAASNFHSEHATPNADHFGLKNLSTAARVITDGSAAHATRYPGLYSATNFRLLASKSGLTGDRAASTAETAHADDDQASLLAAATRA